MSTAELLEARFISVQVAAERSGWNAYQINKLIRNGKLTARLVPGLRPLILESDFDRLLRESTKIATA